MPLDSAKFNKIVQLATQGQTLQQIAAAVGLEMGDVQSALSGVANTFSGLVGGPVAPGPPATHYHLAGPYDLRTSGQLGIYTDLAALDDFATIPAGSFFVVAFSAEALMVADPSNSGNPLSGEFDITGSPASGTWDDDFVFVNGGPNNFPNDQAVGYSYGYMGTQQGNFPMAAAGVYTKFLAAQVAAGNLYMNYAPQDIKLGARAFVYAETQTDQIAGSKVRNLDVYVAVLASS
jgi:hypothetical protein